MMMMMIKSLFYFICIRNIYYSKTHTSEDCNGEEEEGGFVFDF